MYLGNLSRIPHHSKLYQTLYQILLQRYSFVLLDIIYCKKYEIIMLKHIYYVTTVDILHIYFIDSTSYLSHLYSN